jgi:hypothetical protein
MTKTKEKINGEMYVGLSDNELRDVAYAFREKQREYSNPKVPVYLVPGFITRQTDCDPILGKVLQQIKCNPFVTNVFIFRHRDLTQYKELRIYCDGFYIDSWRSIGLVECRWEFADWPEDTTSVKRISLLIWEEMCNRANLLAYKKSKSIHQTRK